MGKRAARAAAAAAAEEKRKLGLEQAELQREKEGIMSRQLGARRSAIGRSAETKIGAKGGGGLMSSLEQQQRAQDIEFVSQNIGMADLALKEAQKRPQPQPIMSIGRDPLAAERQQLAAAKEDIQRVNRGERPLLAAIKLPEKPKNTGPISFGR